MELQGTGFRLRGWKLGDAVSLQKHADNPNISCFLLDRFPQPYTLNDADIWITLMLRQNSYFNFAITIDDEVVGGIALEMREDVYKMAPLLGYWLGEEFWGKGIMSQAVKLMVDYAFATLDIVRIQAGVFSNNPKSAHILEKNGFVKEAVLKNNIFKNGEVLDEWIYVVVKE